MFSHSYEIFQLLDTNCILFHFILFYIFTTQGILIYIHTKEIAAALKWQLDCGRIGVSTNF